MAPNKTPAAQLYGEFKEFFPHNAVEHRHYHTYYQPEAYVPSSDTYIEKATPRSTTTSSRCAWPRRRRCCRARIPDRRHGFRDLRPAIPRTTSMRLILARERIDQRSRSATRRTPVHARRDGTAALAANARGEVIDVSSRRVGNRGAAHRAVRRRDRKPRCSDPLTGALLQVPRYVVHPEDALRDDAAIACCTRSTRSRKSSRSAWTISGEQAGRTEAQRGWSSARASLTCRDDGRSRLLQR